MPVLTGEQMLLAAVPRPGSLLRRLALLWCALALPAPRRSIAR